MDVAISVILPVYNGEKFLGAAVKSVLGQSFSDWELLIVENGSTDNTTAVAKTFLGDERIQLLHSEKGVSNARNLGLARARGEWILFLDADDRLPERAMEQLLGPGNAEKADLVAGEYAREGRCYTGKRISFRGRKEIDAYIGKCLNEPTRRCTLAAVLFRRSAVVAAPELRFDTTLSHAEDSVFVLQVLLRASTVTCVDVPAYRYTYNPNSAVRSGGHELFPKYKESILRIRSILKNTADPVQSAFPAFVLCQVLIVFVNHTFASAESYGTQKKQAMDILDDPVVEQALGQVDLRRCGRTKKIAFRFMRRRNIFALRMLAKARRRMNQRRAKEETA